MLTNRLALSLLLLIMSSCAVVQRIETAVDCSGICSRYASCFDKRYDTDACETRCRASARADTDFRLKAEHCNACISERSCVSATFACAAECVSVVP